MLVRAALPEIQSLLQQFPAVGLLGPRQVGKTTLAHQIAESNKRKAVYLDLEQPPDLARLNDPHVFFDSHEGQMVILDEIQRAPELFAVLRGIIDARRRKGKATGQFLILGSASGELLRQASESLAGRIAYYNLSGLTLPEVAMTRKSAQDVLWLRGGFPQSYLAKSDQKSLVWRQDFIRTYLERDVPQFGIRIPATTLRNFWTMLAHVQASPINLSRLAGGLGVAAPTVGRYLDLLSDLFLVRKLHPWFSNIGKRLVKAPKVYIRDTGLAHALLNIPDFNALLGHPAIGESWEGFVIENLLTVIPNWITPHYYRTATGMEVDLFLDMGHKKRVAIEIKRASAPALSKGFYVACADLKATHRFVVYSGVDAYPVSKDVCAMPLAAMMQEIHALASKK